MNTLLVRFAKLYIQRKASPPTVISLLLRPTSFPSLVVLAALGTMVFVAIKLPSVWIGLIVGLCIGAAARDLGIAIKAVKYWPAQSELMDWAKIEEVVSGENVS